MVNATVDNSPVSITLSSGESTSVPSGEVWNVTMYIASGSDGSNSDTGVEINGRQFYEGRADFNRYDGITVETTLTGGDTITCSFDNTSCHIGGFVVNN